jgi:cytochrome c peroxidase
MRARRTAGLVAIVAALLTPAAHAQSLEFDAGERERILAHGPWPLPWSPDPSNRVSGKQEAIAFGERLFFDTRLSGNGMVSCAGCHRPKQHWIDGQQRAIGHTGVDRNTPTVANLRHARWFGWDGASDNLWAQSLRPLVDAREMNFSVAALAKVVRSEPGFACRYRAAFGRPVPADDEQVAIDAAKALAAFQETIVTGRTPFDDFRDALARNDRAAMARYPADAQRGLALFVGRGQCSVCHTGAMFTNGEFHDIGIGYFIRPGVVDTGRHDGIRKLKASPYNLLGRWNDDDARRTATGTRHVVAEHRNFGEFKVPGLRGVAETPPYMHDGSVRTLRDAVRHYSTLDPDRVHTDSERLLQPLKLSDREIDDLVAFLRTLTDPPQPFRRREVLEPACD